MQSFKEEFKQYWSFWWGVVGMWRKEHGINLGLIWKLSPFLTAIGLIGVFAIELPHPWKTVCEIILGIGGFDLVFSFCFIFPYKVWLRDTTALKNRIAELLPLEKYKKEQEGNEQAWLYLVVEGMDLRRNLQTSENQIEVGFSFVSGLVYDFELCRIWVTPGLGGYLPAEAQLDIPEPLIIKRGKRCDAIRKIITIKDSKLLEEINRDRNSTYENKAGRMLLIKAQLKNNTLLEFRGELYK